MPFNLPKHFPLCVNRQRSPARESPGGLERAPEEDLGVLSVPVSLLWSFYSTLHHNEALGVFKTMSRFAYREVSANGLSLENLRNRMVKVVIQVL